MKSALMLGSLAFLLLFPSSFVLAQTGVSEDEVGPFLAGITRQCYDSGDCGLRDIEQVIANLGNYILGLIGVVVLGVYVYGGIEMLISHGDAKRVEKGKKAIISATVGLIIVFVAYAGIVTLENILRNQSLETPSSLQTQP